jgi:DNA repair protein SbcD/Mre11
MSGKAFRFIHASDFHLEIPLHGMVEVPEHLESDFLEAPLSAANRVFDAAISEKADFIVLAGHVLDLRRADAATVDLLYRQFWRMQEAGISVVWCATPSEQGSDWPVAVELPPSVHLVHGDQVATVPIRRGDPLMCHVVVSCAGRGADEFRRGNIPATQGATVFVAHGESGSTIPLGFMDATYWAFGGRHERSEIEGLRGRGAYCGSPQGRSPQEEGAHGCSLVEVDAARQIREHFIATDLLRWLTQRIEMPEDLDQGGLVRMLRERAERIMETSGGRKVLVQWVLEDNDPSRDTRSDLLASRMRRGDLSGEILRILRKELADANSTVWPLAVLTEPPQSLPQGWYEEDTILGDLLRTVQAFQADPKLAIDFDIPKHAEKWIERAGISLQITDAAQRDKLLRQVAVLGVDLLRGDRVLSAEG